MTCPPLAPYHTSPFGAPHPQYSPPVSTQPRHRPQVPSHPGPWTPPVLSVPTPRALQASPKANPQSLTGQHLSPCQPPGPLPTPGASKAHHPEPQRPAPYCLKGQPQSLTGPNPGLNVASPLVPQRPTPRSLTRPKPWPVASPLCLKGQPPVPHRPKLWPIAPPVPQRPTPRASQAKTLARCQPPSASKANPRSLNRPTP